ncbi:MAG: hypothetical protein WCP21_04890, partial [Armatimonadota bacterium]
MRTPFTRRQQKVVLAALLTALVAISGTRVMGTRFIAKMTNPPLVAPATRPLPAPTTDPQVPTVPPLATPPELPLPPANVAPSPPTGVTPTARPISLCLAKPLTCVLSPQLKEAFKHDRKHTYPITLTWPLIQGASRYVAELTPLWSRTPVVTLESASYCRTVNERELPPGAYEWTVAVYDSRGQCLGSIEPSDPLRVFAVQDSRPIRSNGKAALLDLRASKGTIDAWGSCNHAQYMIVELLQQAGFAVDVNPNQPLSSATLAHTDLLICSYHWVRPRFNPFSPEEIAAIRDFVQAGGGLLLTASGGGNMASYADVDALVAWVGG